MDKHSLNPNDIARVEVGVLEAGAGLVADPIEQKRNPESIVDAQFSMPFGAAIAILHRDASLSQYCLENIRSAEVRALMQKVECRLDPVLEKEFPRKWPAQVKIVAHDGSQYDLHLDHPKGDPENPLSWEEVKAKFNTLVTEVIPDQTAQSVLEDIEHLETREDIRPVFDKLVV
jgi:2-methylcitrate dehydratase PrpD